MNKTDIMALNELADMWEEISRTFKLSRNPFIQANADVYSDCAHDLRRYLKVDKKMLEKIAQSA